MSLGPFDLTGGPFLILYSLLFAATLIAGIVIPRRLRPEGRRRRVDDPDQLAFLAGGRARFADTLVARLLAAKSLEMSGRSQFLGHAAPAAATPAERSVLALPQPIGWREIARTLKGYAEPIERRLIEAGLLMTGEERANQRFWTMLPFAMLLMFGVTKWAIGDMREKPVGYLTLLLVLTLFAALIRWLTLDRRTQAGRDALAEAEVRAERLKRAPATDEIGLAVALFGTAVLVGSGWADFHKLRSAGDGGGGGGCSGDGGGGGGGGCGGCGG